MIPLWLTTLSWFMLGLGFLCALIISFDLLNGHKQHMWIMNLVWPISSLFGTVLVLWGYFKYGRLATHRRMKEAKDHGQEPPSKRLTPFPVMVAKGALHCGSGCTLGDICAEFLAFTFPAVATWFGWKWLFPDTSHGKVFAMWIIDYLFAFLFGIAFQYFTIKPMRNLSPKEGLIQAVKADTVSLTSWQVGMYGYMAFAIFFLFGGVFHSEINPGKVEFWFMMQIAMLTGFVTSYPVNWLLIRKGVKEKM